jgi:hypothetical protein
VAPIQQNDSTDEAALLAGATAAPTQQKHTSDEIPMLAASQHEDVVDNALPLEQTVAQEHVVPDDSEDTQLERQIVVTYENPPLKNVSDDLARAQITVHEVPPILTLVSDFSNIKNIVVGPDDVVDLVALEQAAAHDGLAETTQIEFHSNSRIQQDMELWHHVREYDKKIS